MKRRLSDPHLPRHALQADKRGGGALILIITGFRAFVATVIHTPELGNAFWLAILLGMALGMIPAGLHWLIHRAGGGPAEKDRMEKGWLSLLPALIWIPVFLMDGALVFQTLVSSADFATNSVSHFVVQSGTALGLFFLCKCGAGSIGGASMVYIRLGMILAAVVLIVQLPNMHLRWLTPILGAGWPILIRCSLRTAGLFSLSAAIPAAIDPEADKTGRLAFLCILISGLTAAAMAAVYTMMAPALPSAPSFQTFRLDTVLSNGRSPLALQFPISLIWFGGLFLTLGGETALCVRWIKRLLPRLRESLFCGAAALFLLIFNISGAVDLMFHPEIWYFPLACVPLLLRLVLILVRRRKVTS